MSSHYRRIVEEMKDGICITIYVKPESREDKLIIEDGELVFYTTEPPVRGRANAALTRKLSKLFNTSSSKIQIVYGYRSRTKKVFIKGISIEEAEKILESL